MDEPVHRHRALLPGSGVGRRVRRSPVLPGVRCIGHLRRGDQGVGAARRAATLLSTTTPAELAADPSLEGAAYYAAVQESIGGWLHWLLELSKAAGAAFAAMVGQGAGSRIIMEMDRERRLPHALARVSERTGVPTRSILITATGNIVVAVWAASRADGLDILSSIVNVGALTAFILLHVSVIGYYLVRQRAAIPGTWFMHGVIPAIGAVLPVIVLAPTEYLALIVGLVWFVIGLLFALVAHRQPAVS